MVAQLFHADGQTERQTDGQTDMTKLTVDFFQFCYCPSKESDQTTTVRLFVSFPVFTLAINNVLPSWHEDARSEVLTAVTMNISFF